jgi:cytosine/adenosine deaminase-related metal-dependent hydrolase
MYKPVSFDICCMGPNYTLILRKAYVQNRDDVIDIGVENGRIKTVKKSIPESASTEIDVDENVVTPGFVDPLKRLDRALTARGDRLPIGHDRSDKSIKSNNQLFDEYYKSHPFETIVQNVVDNIQMAAIAGTTHIRSQVAVDHSIGTELFKICEEAKRRTEDIVTIELIPTRTAGVSTDRSGPLIRDVFEKEEFSPHHVIGDCIDLSCSPGPAPDIEGRLDSLFELATEYDSDIDVEICPREAAGYYIFKRLIDKIKENQYEGRVSTVHNYSLAHLPDWALQHLLEEFKNVGVSLMTHCGSIHPSMPVKTILKQGIPLAHCTDNDRDFVTPHGNSDQLASARMISYKLTGGWESNQERGYSSTNPMLQKFGDMITSEAAKLTDLEEYGIEEGAKADLVVFDEPSIQWAIIKQPDRKYVIKEGNIIVQEGEPIPEYEVSEYR